MYIYLLIAVALISPLVFALPRAAKGWFALGAVCAASGAAVVFAAGVLATGDTYQLSAGFDPVFGFFNVAMDRFSALFSIMISLAAVAVTIYGRGYIPRKRDEKSDAQVSLHYTALVLLVVSMLSVVVCRDAYGFLFSWELMSLSSFLLILYDAQRREVRRAALNYLVLMHIGFVFLLAAFTLISDGGLDPSFDSLGFYFATHKPFPVFLLFLAGFGMKCGIFPLHLWLPEAHPAAPAHISALMSGVMIKMGVYGILRVVSEVSGGLYAVGLTLFIIGVVTGLWGAILAALQNGIKRLLAYSSIENIGIIFIGIGASCLGRAAGSDLLAVYGMAGALLHTVNHSFFKTLLFLGAGNVYSACHTDSLDLLGGVGKRMPVTSMLFLLGALAIMALPPLNGFISEYLVYYGFFATVGAGSDNIIAAMGGIVSLSLIGGVIMLAFTKLYGVVFLGTPRTDHVKNAAEVSRGRLGAMALPAAGILLAGFLPFVYTDGLLSLSCSMCGMQDTVMAGTFAQAAGITAVVAILLLLMAALMFYRRMSLRRRERSQSPVWGCGFTAATSRMQYSGESFSEGLYGISTSLTRNVGSGGVVDKNEIFPSRHTFDVRRKDSVSTLFAAAWIRLIKWVHLRVVRFNTGRVNHYIMYALLFFTIILILTVTNLI